MLRRFAIALATVCGAGFLLGVGLLFYVRTDGFRLWIASEIAQRSGYAIETKALSIQWPGQLVVVGLVATKPGVNFAAESIRTTLTPLDLVTKTVHRLQLDRPILRLDLAALRQATAKTDIAVALRQLNVQDGTVVIKTADGGMIDFPGINLTAQNLNLARDTGLRLRMEVPKLNADAEITARGHWRTLSASVILRAKPAQKLLDRLVRTPAQPELANLTLAISAPEGERAKADIAGDFRGLPLGAKSLAGKLTGTVDAEQDFSEFRFNGAAALDDFLASIAPLGLKVPSGNAPLSFTGTYSPGGKRLQLTKVNLTSAIGNLNGAADIDFTTTPTLSNARAKLEKIPLALLHEVFPVANVNYQGIGTIEFSAAGPLKTPRITGHARSDDLQLRGKNFAIANAALAVPFELNGALLRLSELRGEGKKLSYDDPGRLQVTASQAQLDIPGPVEWNFADVKKPLTLKGVLRSDSAQLRGAKYAVDSVTVAAPFEWSAGRLSFTDARLAAKKLSYDDKGKWQAAAESMQLDGRFDYQADQPLRLAGRVRTSGAKFTSADNAKVGENLALSGPIELVADGSTTSFTGQLAAESGELLWNKFFGDLRGPKPRLEIDASYLPASDRLECRRCHLTLAGIGALNLSGAVEQVSGAPRLALTGRADNLAPAGFFDYFIRETYNRQYPILDKLTLGGLMSLQFRSQGSLDALSLSGELAINGGELRAKSNDWEIGPMSLSLPFQVQLGGAKPPAGNETRTGTLAIHAARFGAQKLGTMTTTLSLANNNLRFHQPIRLAIFAGAVEIANLNWPDLIASPQALSFSAEVKRLQLDDLTVAFGWPRFSGTLSGATPEVQTIGNVLRTKGEIAAELFGGRLRIGQLEIQNPFSSLASIKLDARLHDIQLEQASKTFAFGRISGILEGTIDDLVMIDGQPSELRADLHSVDRGTEQRISVEALNKISVLSSGQDSGALYGGLAGFFDSFRYSKLGFKVVLKNDRLTLRGVESRAGQELLVVGSVIPPTVNIVSHTQSISFSELLRRLQRVQSERPEIK